jgi:2-phosphosulfolactate phosphatase
MRVWCSLLPSLSDAPLLVECAIVIDVLRATSVITTAFDANARDVTTCLDIADALQLGQQVEPRPLLCGERKCKPIEGFDLGNSPAEYTEQAVSGRSLVMTTTNGTRAIAAANDAGEIVLASFLNLAAVVGYASRYPTLHLICAGTDGQITGEDVLLAGAILCRLADSQSVAFENDSCALATHYWQGNNGSEQSVPLASRFASTLGGRNLIAAGFESDLSLCAAIDVTGVIPRCIARAPYRFVADR